jgi:NADPH:quinone reductase-like Zn-dependent oxidoreductase
MPDLAPVTGEVLVQVSAAAINPSDIKNVAGVFGTETPRTPGRDYAGIVVSDGPWQGKAVWGSGAGFGTRRDGSHATHILVPEDSLSEKPAGLSMVQAAVVGVPYVTAWEALVTCAQIRPGETLLVVGSSGAVGRAAAQIAHWKGAKVIGADRTGTSTGLEQAIDTREGKLTDQVIALTGGRGVDLTLDTVGGELFEPALTALRIGGRHVAITSSGPRRVSFDLVDFYHRQGRLIGLDTMKLDGPRIAAILSELRLGFDAGALRLGEIDTWPLARAVEAYKAVDQRLSRHAKALVMPLDGMAPQLQTPRR